MTVIVQQPAPDTAGARRWSRFAMAFYGSYVVILVVAATVAAVAGATAPDAVTGPSIVLFSLIGLGLAIRASRHGALDRRTRLAWRVVSGSFVLLLAVPLCFVLSGDQTFPTPGDIVKLGFMVTLLVALLLFPLRSTSRVERYKIGIDVATIVAGCAMVLWYFEIGPQLGTSHESVAAIFAAAAFPVGDLALIFGLATVQLQGADRSVRRPLFMIGLAVGFFVVNDVFIGYVQQHPSSVNGAGWQFVCLMTAHFLLAAAAFEQCRQVGANPLEGDSGPRARSASKLPYAAVSLGYALMVAAAAAERHAYPWVGLVLGGATITGLVVVRQVMLQRESHKMAVTDTLTGLANRSRLQDMLDRSLARGQRSNRLTAALLIDMNGFKQVNDTMGHKAGDQLLIAFGEILTRNVLGGDLVGRLGGDEFAVVLQNLEGPDDAQAVARRIVAEMQEAVLIDGALVAPRASIGIALAPPGEMTADELLHRADVAMYRAKRMATTAWELYTDPTTPASLSVPSEHSWADRT